MARSLPLPTPGDVFISPAKHGMAEVRVEVVAITATHIEFRNTWIHNGEAQSATPSLPVGTWASYSKIAKLRSA